MKFDKKSKSKKIDKKAFVILFLLIGIFAFNFNFLTVGGYALLNGPNYWGMGFPGGYHAPLLPEEYRFIGGSDYPEGYGSHDWGADGIIRLLRKPYHNPTGFEDWSWLLNRKVANYHNPQWESVYTNSQNYHSVVRSYITYLFTTEMPDASSPTRCQSLTINHEGVTIGDINCFGGMWVGQHKQHSYHFIISNINNTLIYTPNPSKIQPITKTMLLAEQAINCIANKGPDSNGEIVSKMKPESVAAWLGAITHYFLDLSSPAHLLAPSSNVYVKGNNGFHDWYENQLGTLTLWSGNSGSYLSGPDERYFNTNPILPIIEPIRPDIAITTLAYTSIGISYGLNGKCIYDQDDPDSGLYINDTEDFWDWGEDLSTGFMLEERRANSKNKFYYEKVQFLLSSAIYFCACALQWIFNTAKEELGGDPDPNGSAKHPPSDQDTVPLKPKSLRDKMNGDILKAQKMFKSLAKLSPALIPLIPQLIKELNKRFGSRR
jgi:hypothetical protein